MLAAPRSLSEGTATKRYWAAGGSDGEFGGHGYWSGLKAPRSIAAALLFENGNVKSDDGGCRGNPV